MSAEDMSAQAVEGMALLSADGSARVVLTALGANLGVAAAKFVAAAITGSASILAEGVHSVADSATRCCF
jgi:divalent metal cation (Fe/Co/Zn/Cd) transporter